MTDSFDYLTAEESEGTRVHARAFQQVQAAEVLTVALVLVSLQVY